MSHKVTHNCEAMSAAQKAWATRRGKADQGRVSEVLGKVRKARVLVERVNFLAVPKAEMTAGQKAAETRKAFLAARADLETLRQGVQERAAFGEGDAVTLYVDDAKIGCGERLFVVSGISGRTVTLFQPSMLKSVTVDRLSFDRHAKPSDAPVSRLADRISTNATQADRLSLEYSPREVRKALALLAA